MYKTKVIKVLKTFRKVELNRFDKYVRSPYYNVHTPTLLLWEAIHKTYPDFDEKQLKKEKLFEDVFPGEKFNDAKLSVVRNNLLNLLFGFFSRVRVEQQEHLLHRELLIELSSRKLDDFLPRLIKEGRSKLEKRPDLGYEKFQMEDFVAEYNLLRSNRSTDVDFQAVMNQLDNFYLSQKLKYIAAMKSRQRVLDVEYEISFGEEILAFCKVNDLSDKVLVRAYYLANLLFNPEGSEEAFKTLVDLLENGEDNFGIDDQTNLFGFLITYSNEYYKAGKMEYLKQMFHIYKLMLVRNLLFESSMISSVHYRNLVSIALKLNEYEWAENFIQEYKDKIEFSYRESLYHYNLARLYFSRKEFQKVLPHLHKFTPIDSINKFSYNLLLMETYYECNEVDAFFSLCVSYRTYIRRSKSLSARYKHAYLNFISFSKKLFQYKTNPTKKFSAESIIQEFQGLQPLEDRGWLEEKLIELIKAN